MTLNEEVRNRVAETLLKLIGQSLPDNEDAVGEHLPLIIYGVIDGLFNALSHVFHLILPDLNDAEIMERTKKSIEVYLKDVHMVKEEDEADETR